MELSITTDYAQDKGCPEPYLKRIAEAGFTHVHWCHQWNTDFIYSDHEVRQIASWLKQYSLKLLDLHASMGQEKNWASPVEYERLSGVELVRNRIEMTARLGSKAVIMHIPKDPVLDQVRKSLDALEADSVKHGVRIAIENGIFRDIRILLSEYRPGFLGLCYDSGHGNVSGNGLEELEGLKERLISVHLHDNKGPTDEHNLLFSGTIDLPRLAGIIRASSYTGCVSMEVNMKRAADISDEGEFLAKARETGERFSLLVRPG